MILHSKIFGKGFPVLVLHGLFGNGDNWSFFAKIFSKNFQIHLLDVRNHGNSFYSNKMDYDLISEDIFKYIHYYKLQNPILLGHSMGGRSVMKFSMKYPFIPRKIIIVDISPNAYKNTENENIIFALKKVNFNIIKTRRDLVSFLKTWIVHLETRLFFSKCTYRKENGKLSFRFFLPGIEKNYKYLIQNEIKGGVYNGPALFLRGEYSNYLLPREYPIIRKLFPKSEFLTIDKSNHWVHIDNPKSFYEKVDLFLKN
ncbi:alpha/beta fold hydrolase [Blattabacterium cuenoti]|uniref:alpha/beta fold hydrolase n=1 Tax=Blattabacterium cuenoti TaxID=1653831 RepID=UPI00163BF22E|nr:alpha/beta fold hydrolase [Blattabacterium cuenoti]